MHNNALKEREMRIAVALAALTALAVTLLSVEYSPSNAGFTSTVEVEFSGSVSVPEQDDMAVETTTPSTNVTSSSALDLPPSSVAEATLAPVEDPVEPDQTPTAPSTKLIVP